MAHFMTVLGVWLGAFFTLCIFSFLYKDNPFYKLAEQIFVGLSAGYWFIYTIYSILIPNLFTKLQTDFSRNTILLIPGILGVMMLLRLIPKLEWLSLYPISLVIGTSAGISILRYMKSDVLSQLTATMMNPLKQGSIDAIIGSFILIIGTICVIMYFYFSRKQEGVLAATSKIGIWFLMISFGASFGYTVMARISLLIGRLQFLLGDWLHLIKP
ncbi:MAG TPA: hypothetical protein PKJ14_02425 [Candidatus Cloacimonadota bacterium]|nr:hypothetical protein [Candidatus Cloacimonadota bacterium]HQL14498.1 hypothetical protein [Candidatus Cloacimonadota bacterium]